jgi:AcrR family transcriptional regulator
MLTHGKADALTLVDPDKIGGEKRKPRVRDAEATQRRILEAAKKEFAKKGLGGARVDVIAERARANKRMIYHYFESKENLFQHVLEDAYVDIRTAEQKLALDISNQKRHWNAWFASPGNVISTIRNSSRW